MHFLRRADLRASACTFGKESGHICNNKKSMELNGAVNVGNEKEEGEEEKKDDYVKMTEVEEAKTTEAKNSKTTEVEELEKEEAGDTKREEADDVKDVEMGDEDEEGKKLEEENDVEERDSENFEKKVEERKEAEGEEDGLKKKWMRGQKVDDKGKAKEKKEGGTKAKEMLSTPVASSSERPVRERKTVERLVEAMESDSVKPLLIEKGWGTPVKDIPNVAYKLAKKKPADLRLLHQTLFGRIGKAVNYRNHILQFSGFVWHQNEDKQKTKVKEKLDKCVKDTLMDFCDLFDLPVSKATARKREELVAMLLDFMVAPHATTDVILAEKRAGLPQRQSTKIKKRKRVAKGIGSKSSGGMPVKRSRKSNELQNITFVVAALLQKSIKSEDTPKTKQKGAHETEDEEEEDDENGVPNEDDAPKRSESEEKEIESVEAEDDEDDDVSGKGRQDIKKSSNRGGSAGAKKSKVTASPKKIPHPTMTKSPTISSSERSKTVDRNNGGAKVFSRKKEKVEAPKKKSVLSKPDRKGKASGKMVAKGKAKSKEAEHGPSKEELRKTICEILNKVDFNTATFTDIIKELANHYGMDLTPRKAAIKLMIQEELTKLADEAEENEDGEEEEGAGGKD